MADYHGFYAFLLLRSNTVILRLPFELYPLIVVVINIIIIISNFKQP